jgi:hypothetical protein
MTIISIIPGLVIVGWIIGRVASSLQFNKEVQTLFSHSGNISGSTFQYSQLTNLPEPVQRYFKHVLKEEQPYISYVRLRHDGQFKTDPKKDWVNIQGEQYFTIEKPGFVWKGSTAMVTARDMYLLNKGRLVITILSLLKIADKQGEKYDHGELLRWLAENVWFPTNLLPNKNLQWIPVDSKTANLIYNYNGLSISYQVTFNSIGEITQLQTKRYMGDAGLETWVGNVSHYKELNGIMVPTEIEAIYRLKTGDHSYAKFKVKTIEYDKPYMF